MEDPRVPRPLQVPSNWVSLRRPSTAKAFLALVVALAAMALTFSDVRAVGGVGVLAAAAALGAAIAWVGRGGGATLSVDGHGLDVAEGASHSRFERGDVIEGLVIPTSPAKLQLRMRSGVVVEASLPSVEAADALLDHLALDPKGRALRFPANAPFRQLVGAFGGVMLGSYIGFYLGILLAVIGLTSAIALAVPLAAAFAAMGIVSTRPIEVRVGTDGLTLRGAFKTRFIPFAELAAVRPFNNDPMLCYRDGRTEVVWNSAVSRSPELLAALLHRMDRALASNAEHDALMARAAVLERRGRTLDAWRAEVARLVDPAKGYRDLGLSRAEAEALLDDVRAPLEHRIAAAMALRALDDQEAPTRIRVAADGCASPEMREALQRAGDGTLDEAAVDRAVQAVERGRGWV